MCFLDVVYYLRRHAAYKATDSHSNRLSRAESSVAIFKLTDACFIKIFQWLPLQELHAIGQTCKRFQRLTARYFQRNYPATMISYNCDGTQVYGRELSGIGRYAQNISRWGRDLEKFLADHTKSEKSLKHIRLERSHLPGTQIKWTKPILHQIEIFDLINCKIESTFYENFLKLCVHLRRLRLKNVQISVNSNHDWLRNRYPLLEYLELSLLQPCQIDELRHFFEKNPNIRRFATNKSTLWANMDAFSGVDIKLDELIVEIDNGADQVPDTELLFEFLNQLHDRGVYTRLHLSGVFSKQETVYAMSGLRNLEKVNIGVDSVNFDFSSLTNLRELVILWVSNLVNMKMLAKCLTNLEKIGFWKASIDDIVPFVRYSINLKEIKIHNFVKNTALLRPCICSDASLHKERKKLNGACKVTIFIEENICLAAKWNTIQTNTRLVEIKRVESQTWGHHFLSY